MALFGNLRKSVKQLFKQFTGGLKQQSQQGQRVQQAQHGQHDKEIQRGQDNQELKDLETLKARLQPIIDEANYRWNVLDELDLRSLAISRALDESENRFFSFDNLSNPSQVISEATRARVFINDETSTPEGAELYTRQESYKQWRGQFGNQYNNWENKFRRYNVSTISEDNARVAFSAYRRLEESEAARIITYGSENMIIAIYDMVINNGYSDVEDLNEIDDIVGQARDLLDREIGIKRAEFEEAFREGNEVGNILDVVTAERDYLGRGMW